MQSNIDGLNTGMPKSSACICLNKKRFSDSNIQWPVFKGSFEKCGLGVPLFDTNEQIFLNEIGRCAHRFMPTTPFDKNIFHFKNGCAI